MKNTYELMKFNGKEYKCRAKGREKIAVDQIRCNLEYLQDDIEDKNINESIKLHQIDRINGMLELAYLMDILPMLKIGYNSIQANTVTFLVEYTEL